jgi:hypothetical protein
MAFELLEGTRMQIETLRYQALSMGALVVDADVERAERIRDMIRKLIPR